MAVDALGAGEAILIHGTGVCAEADNFTIDASDSATLEMLNSALQQSAATGVGASLVSAFQTNMIAIRALALCPFRRRAAAYDAVAKLQGAAWGVPVPVS